MRQQLCLVPGKKNRLGKITADPGRSAGRPERSARFIGAAGKTEKIRAGRRSVERAQQAPGKDAAPDRFSASPGKRSLPGDSSGRGSIKGYELAAPRHLSCIGKPAEI